MKFTERVTRRLWKIIHGQISYVDHRGDFRTKERYGRLFRPNYAYGLLRAADVARYFGLKAITAVEFGVASGNGLINMAYLAELVRSETDIQIHVVGFDTGYGLPKPNDFRDHPELWTGGDFRTPDRNRLELALRGRAEMVWGDIAETLPHYLSAPRPPIGFVSIDVDIYSATRAALQCFSGSSETCMPAVSVYLDDVCFFFANEWCGELAAVREFNELSRTRKIDIDRSLPGSRYDQTSAWYKQMYICHILDHPARQHTRERASLGLNEHVDLMASHGL